MTLKELQNRKEYTERIIRSLEGKIYYYDSEQAQKDLEAEKRILGYINNEIEKLISQATQEV